MPRMANLFGLVQLGSLVLANRVFMAPLTRNRADADGVPGKLAATYYPQRASAGQQLGVDDVDAVFFDHVTGLTYRVVGSLKGFPWPKVSLDPGLRPADAHEMPHSHSIAACNEP